MNKQIREKLERISELIDPQHIRRAEDLQDKTWALKSVERVPVVMLDVIPLDHPLYPYHEAFADPDKMFWNELILTYVGVLLRDDRMFTLRANYGPAIIPSMFGATYSADANTTWIEGFHDIQVIRRLIERGMPDVNTNLGGRAFETQKLYHDYLEEFKLGQYIHLVQTDTQGPFDVAELIWGAEIYQAMYDEPSVVHQLLDLVTETIITFIHRQKRGLHEPRNQMYHWWYKVPAGARIVDDVTITLSSKMYGEFVKPYNDRVFEAFGNGYMHYCGHGLQNQHLRLHTSGLRGVEMASANVAENVWEYNLASIWKEAYEHGVTLCWIGPGLPAKRPDIPSGLIYLCSAIDKPYEQVESYHRQVKEFWSQPPAAERVV